MKSVIATLTIQRVALVLTALVTFLNARTALGDSFQFSLNPASGNISGVSSSTVGWGYSITNQSSSDWLVTTNLTADSFAHGTPNLLFDFPDLAPNQTVVQAFDASAALGLYEISWDSDAPSGFVNSGDFILSAQWWDGDPTSNGNFIADAPDIDVTYSASVSSSPVPEPSTWPMFLSLAVAVGFAVRRESAKCFHKHECRPGPPIDLS